MTPRTTVLYAAGLLLSWVIPSNGQDINEALLERFDIFAQYAAASGCDQNNNSTDSSLITCDYGCPLLTYYGDTTLYEFQNRGLGDVTGYLALDNFRKLIVLVFRGSTSSQNWRADLNFLAYWDWLLCPNCYVHAGFWASWKSVEGDVLWTIRQAVTQYPDYQLVFTGHSLGGAVATMGATLVRSRGCWGDRSIDLVGSNSSVSSSDSGPPAKLTCSPTNSSHLAPPKSETLRPRGGQPGSPGSIEQRTRTTLYLGYRRHGGGHTTTASRRLSTGF
ncbi:lipase family protein [Aspergillus mulundensis]|uniref:feruloyl esterase n=1 Tax=Aspergillus mulundensis TaxID=1810919 RepID=A0A3D8SB87_9EURO|nr:hypothetical protein DSM5745_03948 [Aspergillus mulundensis]RDW83622.1 hypothetical protein DSM5745_03948 [Aspergillus mulundensis]